MSGQSGGFLKKAEKIIYGACRGISFVVPVLLIAIMLLVVADVLLRALFKSPIVGTTEIVECMIAVAGFLSMAWCTINGRNIRVDIMSRRLKTIPARILDSFVETLSFCIVPLLFWQHFWKTIEAYNSNEMSDILRFKMFPVYGIITIGFFFLIFAQLVIAIKAIAGKQGKEDVKE